MMKRWLRLGLIWLMVSCVYALPVAADLSSGEIPPELGRWRSWVLHGQEDALCPTAYNDGDVARCQWPTQLTVNVQDDGALFEQSWLMFARGWVSLPGSPEMWPDGVVVDGNSVAVVNRGNQPSIRLSPGEHHIKGRFYWLRTPEMMRVPPSVGLISLTVGGQKIDSPVIDANGRLWLAGRKSQSVQEDQLKVRIFRLVDDSIPMRLTTLLRLDISGQAREIHLKNVLTGNAIPEELVSLLPARLSAGGDLLIQARPGRWELRLIARMPGPVTKISFGKSSYGDEVWSFQPKHHLRMVEIGGVPQVEPGQTDMPDEWRQFAAYLVKPVSTMQFKEIRRGDPEPVPDQLSLFRRWWLDFDGKGMTLQDTIDGTLSRQWYLAVNSPMVLGRVAVDGKDQVITAQGDELKAGVELRRGNLKLQSDARLPNRTGSLNAVGWDHDFKKVSGELHLPPGWRLMAAMGVDQVSDTWLQRWSLLDFFAVLMIALAVFKLRGWRWGILALVTMVLLFHEQGAPRMVWLHILTVLALLPLLPENWIKRAVSFWGVGAVLTLLIISIPFVVHQMRWGIYPQLAPHNDDSVMTPAGRQAVQITKKAAAPQKNSELLSKVSPRRQRIEPEAYSISIDGAALRAGKAVWHQDPDALIPTGPGLPEWRWHTVRLNWNGPVARDQGMRLLLLSPGLNLFMAFLRVSLLSLFIWGVIDWRPWWYKFQKQLTSTQTKTAIMLFVLVGAQWSPVNAEGGGVFPPNEMLETLKQRLLEPPDCLPYCADVSRLEVAVSGDNLRIILKVHAASQTAIPLPVNRKSWTPDQVLLDNAPISGMSRDKGGGLWAVVPSGLHTVIMLGNIAQEGLIQIPLPLKPHLASYAAKGWAVKGILPDGTVGSSIQLTRVQEQRTSKAFVRDTRALTPFLHVRRELHLGLTWQVSTTIERVTPKGTPVVVNLPLLANESMTTAGFHVDKGHVLINMSADQSKVSFMSALKVTPTIQLIAPQAVPWTERWVLDASPIWHCDLEGISVIHHQDRGGQWQPQWQPWPGESVRINIQRPKAIDGQMLTIQKADLIIDPGRRFSRGKLSLNINSSRGGQHTVELPPKTNLQEVRVGGKSLPVQQDGQWVTVPLQPGVQNIDIQWHQLAPLQMWQKIPLVKIGKEAVNAHVTLNLPQKRWVLLAGGPRLGPAILFWSYLVVIVLVSLGLGRLTITTLKTWQWILLGLGMTQIPVPMVLIIIGWLLALGIRRKRSMPSSWLGFNIMQLGLIILTLLALISLFTAVKAGLIGHPDMQIAGNQSSSWTLNWTQDRVQNHMPQPWVLSFPLWSYRILMLLWSLWLAYSLLEWLKWGWRCFANNGVWKKKPPRKNKAVKWTPKPYKK